MSLCQHACLCLAYSLDGPFLCTLYHATRLTDAVTPSRPCRLSHGAEWNLTGEHVSQGGGGAWSQIEARCCRCRNEAAGPGSIYRLSPPYCTTMYWQLHHQSCSLTATLEREQPQWFHCISFLTQVFSFSIFINTLANPLLELENARTVSLKIRWHFFSHKGQATKNCEHL